MKIRSEVFRHTPCLLYSIRYIFPLKCKNNHNSSNFCNFLINLQFDDELKNMIHIKFMISG